MIHAEEIWYKTHKPAVRDPPDPPREYRDANAVVAYVSVEKGDDESTVKAAAMEILRYAAEMVKTDSIIIYPYAHLSNRLERPKRAHHLLVRLEEELRRNWEGRLHRAPFGWYKEFRLHAKGHPLSELSRSIEPGSHVVAYRSGGRSLTLKEAVKEGLLPKCLGIGSPGLNRIAQEKLDLFGVFGWSKWLAQEMVDRLIKRLRALYGPPEEVVNTPYAENNGLLDLAGAGGVYRAAMQAKVGSLVGAPLPSSVYKYLGDPLEFLIETNKRLEDSLVTIPLCGEEPCLDLGVEGELILYNGGACLPLGVRGKDWSLLGPLGNIIVSLIDVESRMAVEGDHTPTLPVWLHPVTAYIIPVAGVEEYANTLARELASVGAGVIVDNSMKGVGGRVRRAGKHWVPYTLTVGRREADTGTVTVRRRWRPGSQEVVPLGELVSEVKGLLSVYGVVGFVWHLS